MITKFKGIRGKMEIISIPTPFPVGDVNIYLLIDDAVSLVDVGPNTEEAWECLLRGLKSYGLTIQDIDQILLTHHHIDHFGLAARVLEAGRAKLYSHPLAKDYITLNESFFDRMANFFHRFYIQNGVPEEYSIQSKWLKQMYQNYGRRVHVSGWLNEGQTLPGHEGWTVYHMPGHSQDQLCFYHEKEQTLLAADHLIKHISSNAIIEAPIHDEERPKTLLQYRDSMKKCLNLTIKEAYSGHGEPMKGVKELILHRLDQQDERAMEIKKWLDQKPMNVYEISCRLFGDKAAKDMPLVVSEVVGHLDLLEAKGLVTAENREGRMVYKTV